MPPKADTYCVQGATVADCRCLLVVKRQVLGLQERQVLGLQELQVLGLQERQVLGLQECQMLAMGRFVLVARARWEFTAVICNLQAQAPGARCQVPRDMCQVLNVRSQVSGAHARC
jgi:hypothetical protein